VSLLSIPKVVVLYGQTVPSEMRNKELFTYRRPYGVTAIVTPSNFPIAVASWKAIPALLCGNTVVWKTPPEAPNHCLRICQTLATSRDCLMAC
jgi:acyl-CoA reductase-like NAD-dependent aldehyde dehydrogenase